MTSNILTSRLRKQVLSFNLIDEYVQMRHDELVKEREHLPRSDDVKKSIWYTADLQETLIRTYRQSFKNDSPDFADSELLLEDFSRCYSDDTLEKPLTISNSSIGI